MRSDAHRWIVSARTAQALRPISRHLKSGILHPVNDTEPLIRCYIEAKSAKQMKKLETACRKILAG